jgi:NADH-quinone oxidoreductase subunit F
MTIKTKAQLDKMAKAGKKAMDGERPQLIFGLGTCGIASGGRALLDFAEKHLAKKGADVQIISVGCIGMCHAEPLVDVKLPGRPRVSYPEVTEEKLKEIIDKHLLKSRPVKELALTQFTHEMSISDEQEPKDEPYPGIPTNDRLPFFTKQARIVLRNCGIIDPESIDEYMARGGYASAFKAVHEMSPEEVIEEVKKSGLRGRGGAGFPTGLKWEFCRKAPGSVKYLICNADEGDPGAYINRAVLEGDPHTLLEGMIIAGYAMGSTEGFIYVRTEYPLAIDRLKTALEQAEKLGILGENMMGSSFSFRIHIREGAGVFVCGEETALIKSIEGKRGEPRPRPPFPATQGLWGKPTNINNVETLANIPIIIKKGGAWLSGIGTETGKGTKGFSLVGKINRPGLVEVPLGIPMKDIIYEIGGGIPDGRGFKAVQTGGPSGGCIPADKLDVPVDYENLKALGSIVGSGGMVVMDEDTCMVDVAKYFLEFTSEESCGQCTPCRVGTKKMLELLEKITSGHGAMEDIALLEELASQVSAGSLCALGGTAPNPVLTTLKNFRSEYEEHITGKYCKASTCAALFKAPCQNTCPAGTNVPGFIQLIAEGRYADAYEMNRLDNPLPAVCGRVCEHPCEARCQRVQMDEPLSVRELKRFCSDALAVGEGRHKPTLKKLASNGKSVGVVGGGPSGLAAAHFLAHMGYSVTIFESSPELGGMLRYGIPRYRLPADVLDREIADIRSMGVEVVCNCRIGKDTTLLQLIDEFDAVYLAIGAQNDKALGVEGENLDGVMPGLKVLRDINSGKKVNFGKSTLIIGGGNVAIDVARSALRAGAKVTVAYRREEIDMPAYPEEIKAAKEEGVEFVFLAAPKSVFGKAGKASGMAFERQEMREYTKWGRRSPGPTGETFDIAADTIVTAIGQELDSSFSEQIKERLINKRGLIDIDPKSRSTPLVKVFAGGDAVSGPASVIDAIADAKEAAMRIDDFLLHRDGMAEWKELNAIEYGMEAPTENEQRMERQAPGELDVAKRMKGYAEVVTCLEEDKAKLECRRCLRCDLSSQSEEVE